MNEQPRHRLPAAPRDPKVRALALVALLAVVALSATGFSSATFSSQSEAATGTVTSSDWTGPTVSVQDPGSPVRGTVALEATAADDGTGIKDVAIQYQAVEGAGWTTVCSDTTAPYGCSWATTSVADGAYDVRAVATDVAGNATTSDSVRTVVANNASVVLSDVPDVVRGSISLETAYYNIFLPLSVSVQYRAEGSTVWRTACTNFTPLASTCTWNTTTVPNGSYELRSVVTTLLGSYYSPVDSGVLVDNSAPTVTMSDPGTPLAGTRTFSATASDADSGVAQVVVQVARTGTSTWQTLCTITDAPFSCRVDTTTLANASYSVRAVATDVAGNTTTSAVVANRVVDNTASSVSVEDPGAYLNGTTTLRAGANASSGVTSVRIQRAPTGGSTWTDVCTTTTAPYTCSWDTTQVADGGYDLRAVLLDGAGRTTTSAVVANRVVDNSLVRAIDVQAANGGGTVGRLDSGDKLTLTYSEQVKPSSLLAGWDGSSRAVTLRLRDGNLVGGGARNDTVDVLSGSTPVALGSVMLGNDYVKSGKTVTFTATLSATTTTSGSAVRTVVTVQLGAATGSGLRTTSGTSTMVWTPSTAATDLTGNRCAAAPVTETGAADRDF
ncbi:MAG: Ig-like domain-containing protein [Aeromicrobium erythreum]